MPDFDRRISLERLGFDLTLPAVEGFWRLGAPQWLVHLLDHCCARTVFRADFGPVSLRRVGKASFSKTQAAYPHFTLDDINEPLCCRRTQRPAFTEFNCELSKPGAGCRPDMNNGGRVTHARKRCAHKRVGG